MELMEIKLKTLTPLWTGGVDGIADRVHETGILGSLRWWYEAIVRGLEGWACDPSKRECSFDSDKYRRVAGQPERERLHAAGLCDVCQVFGATGWRRRFRLEVTQDDTLPTWTPEDRALNVRPPDRNRGWYLLPGRMGALTLRLDGDEKTLSLLAASFLFLERWGSIGARPQLGYGVFEIANREEVVKWAKDAWAVMGARPPSRDLPDLRWFGFFRYHFRPERPGWWTRVPGMERIAPKVQPLVREHKTMPLTPALKNEWRFHRWRGRREDERNVFGSLRPERVRSKVAVSWAYPQDDGWEVRGWTWLQETRIAAQMWGLVREREGWEAVIGLPGDLESDPQGDWRERATDEVKRLLEEI